MADDPEEFIGSDQSTKADPKGKARRASNDARGSGGANDPPAPALRVAVYTPPAEGASHPKHSVLGPALRVDNAEAALSAAQLELTAATGALRSAEVKEADALSALIAAMPGPTPDELLRQHAAAQLASRARRVEAGESPEAPQVSKIGNSPLDRAASLRPRTSAQAANTPLRSPVVRRTV